MCAVIDASCLSRVFNPDDSEHGDFKPVLDWIDSKKGRMVLGGSKYFRELTRYRRFLGTLGELRKRNLIKVVSRDEVDRIAAQLKQEEPRPQFNDEHLVAMVLISRCSLICSSDKKSHPYLTRRDFYPNRKRPKIYSGPQNKNLLDNIHCVQS